MGAYCYFKFMECDLPYSAVDITRWFWDAPIYWGIFTGGR